MRDKPTSNSIFNYKSAGSNKAENLRYECAVVNVLIYYDIWACSIRRCSHLCWKSKNKHTFALSVMWLIFNFADKKFTQFIIHDTGKIKPGAVILPWKKMYLACRLVHRYKYLPAPGPCFCMTVACEGNNGSHQADVPWRGREASLTCYSVVEYVKQGIEIPNKAVYKWENGCVKPLQQVCLNLLT